MTTKEIEELVAGEQLDKLVATTCCGWLELPVTADAQGKPLATPRRIMLPPGLRHKQIKGNLLNGVQVPAYSNNPVEVYRAAHRVLEQGHPHDPQSDRRRLSITQGVDGWSVVLEGKYRRGFGRADTIEVALCKALLEYYLYHELTMPELSAARA